MSKGKITFIHPNDRVALGAVIRMIDRDRTGCEADEDDKEVAALLFSGRYGLACPVEDLEDFSVNSDSLMNKPVGNSRY